MGAKTAIQWTSSDNGEPGASWNPIRAVNGKWTCVRASEECRFCYAATFNVRMGGPDFGPVGGELPDAARLDDKALLEPLRWKRGRRIFVGSMTDIFGSWVPDAWLDRIFAVMALTPRHTFLLLTKRPQRMKEYLTFGAAGPVPTGNLDSSAPASTARWAGSTRPTGRGRAGRFRTSGWAPASDSTRCTGAPGT